MNARELAPFHCGDGTISWQAFATPRVADWLRSMQVGPDLAEWASWVPADLFGDPGAWVEASGCAAGDEGRAARAGYRWCRLLGLS